MQVIGSKLRDQIDKAAAHSSILSIEGVGHYLELLHRLDADSVIHLQIGGGQFDGRAVHQNVRARLLAAIQLEAALVCWGVGVDA